MVLPSMFYRCNKNGIFVVQIIYFYLLCHPNSCYSLNENKVIINFHPCQVGNRWSDSRLDMDENYFGFQTVKGCQRADWHNCHACRVQACVTTPAPPLSVHTHPTVYWGGVTYTRWHSECEVMCEPAYASTLCVRAHTLPNTNRDDCESLTKHSASDPRHTAIRRAPTHCRHNWIYSSQTTFSDTSRKLLFFYIVPVGIDVGYQLKYFFSSRPQ